MLNSICHGFIAAERRRLARGKGPKASASGGLLAPSNRDTPSRIN